MEAVAVGEDKLSLRREFRAARSRFADESGASVRDAIGSHVRRLIGDLSIEGTQVTIYKPLKEEADFNLGSLDSCFYPTVSGDLMEFRRPQGTPLDLSKPILCFCPAVAVDSFGTRLGMGKGYYDRFFLHVPHAIRIAVAFQIQFSKDPLPVDSWDQPLDWIVTESMILRTSTRSP